MTRYEIHKDISKLENHLKCMDIVDQIDGRRDVTEADDLADLASADGMAAG